MNDTFNFFSISFALLFNIYVMPLIVWWIEDFQFALNYYIYVGLGIPYVLSSLLGAISIKRENYYRQLYQTQKEELGKVPKGVNPLNAKREQKISKRVSIFYEKWMFWESIKMNADITAYSLQANIAIAFMIYFLSYF